MLRGGGIRRGSPPRAVQFARASLLLTGAALHAQAQQPNEAEVYTLGTETVTAYRTPTLLQETVQGVNIVTRREIEARNPASAVELLQQVPGLQIDQVGGPGGLSSAYIRGSDPNHVLVLIDGVRVNDPTNQRGGSYDFSNLDVADIEQIEVIRGAASALYGADAMGGVINIVTKRGRAEGIGGTVSGGLGGQDYRRLQGALSGGTGRVQYAVNASNLQDGRNEDGGEIDLTTFGGSLAFLPTDAMSLRLTARRSEKDSTSFPEDSGGIAFAVLRDLEKKDSRETTFGADLVWDPTERWELNFKVARYERLEDVATPDVLGRPDSVRFPLPAQKFHTDFNRDSALASAAVKLPWDSSLTFGLEHLREKGKTVGTIDFSIFGLPGVLVPSDFDLTRKTNSAFAEFKTRPIQGLVAQAGLRFDDVSGSESETSPSVGVRYLIAPSGTTLKANYSEGFKPPSFFALGNPVAGNPALKPETSNNMEIGVEQGFWGNRAQLGAALFKTEYQDLVDFDNQTNRLVNRDNVDAKGVEAEFRLNPIERLSLRFQYTYVDTEVAATGAPLRQRPKHRAGLSAYYGLTEALQLSWNTEYVRRVFDSSIPTGDVFLPSYSKTDVGVSYKYRWLTAAFNIDNLFDKNYQQFVGFENPGRRARISLTATF